MYVSDEADVFEDRRAIVETVRRFSSAHLAPYASERDAEKIFPIDTLREAGKLGLGGIYVEEDVGGSALSRRDGDALVINGVKQFISGAGASSLYVVMVRTGAPGPHGISAVIIEDGTPGLSFGPEEKKMGWNAQPTRQVILDEVRVPRSHLFGEEGDGFRIAMLGLNGGRVNIGACSVGGAQWALERAILHVQEREAFGQPLVANQSVLFRLADMETQLQASRSLLHRAAMHMDLRLDDVAVAWALAKRFATDASFEVANAALQLHGGYGYLQQYGIERVVRDLRVHQILEGANEIMSTIIGRALVGSPTYPHTR